MKPYNKKSESVEFTKEQVKQFIAVYNEAVKHDAKDFTFDGREYVTAYAYYILQYFVMQKFIAGVFDNSKKFTQHEQQG